MLDKKARTKEVYLEAGAMMRLLKEVGARAVCDVSKVLHAGDQDKLVRALEVIDLICSRAEDNMFRDHPELSDEYLDVFYGGLDTEPRTEIDAKVLEKTKEIADELFA